MTATRLSEGEEPPAPETLSDLLTAMRPKEGAKTISVEEVLARVGARSFPAVILVPAIILVSPISGIPGTPTLGALVVLLITLQAFMGRRHLWLPGFLRHRKVGAERMHKALNWLEKPSGWMDRHSHNRLRILTSGPARLPAYVATALIAASWPLLELLPFVTSFGAGSVAMIMYGLMVRDGAYTLAGYVQGALIYLVLFALWAGVLDGVFG